MQSLFDRGTIARQRVSMEYSRLDRLETDSARGYVSSAQQVS